MKNDLPILCYLFLLSILVLTGCDKDETSFSNAAVIKRDSCAPMDVVTCYHDLDNNEECFGAEICLYVEYKNERLTINDALKQKLITLQDVNESYNTFLDELRSGN